MNNEKDVYAIFDKMFEQLEKDDPDLQDTSAQKFSDIIDSKLEDYAKLCGYADYNSMLDKEMINEVYYQMLENINADNKKDFLLKALSLLKNDNIVSKYSELLNNNDVEEVIEMAREENDKAPHSSLKFLLVAYDIYQKKILKTIGE